MNGSPRLTAVRWAVVTIALGLAVHRLAPPGAARDIAGDALWAIMMFWWVSALRPGRPPAGRAAVALAICWAVEASQLWHTPWLERARSTRLGPLVLGTGFDPRDLLSYTAGVLMAWLFVRWRAQQNTGQPRD